MRLDLQKKPFPGPPRVTLFKKKSSRNTLQEELFLKGVQILQVQSSASRGDTLQEERYHKGVEILQVYGTASRGDTLQEELYLKGVEIS
jgi:hypothetical protein